MIVSSSMKTRLLNLQMMVNVFGYRDAFHPKYGEYEAMINNISRNFEMENDPGYIN